MAHLSIRSIDNLYKNIKNRQNFNIFCDAITTRFAGYRDRYKANFLPTDLADWVDEIYVLYLTDSSNICTPIGVTRISSHSNLFSYGLSIPLVAVLQNAGIQAQKHLEVILDLLDKNHLQSDVFYSSWSTLLEPYKNSLELSELFKEFCVAAVARKINTMIATAITAAVLRFKTHNWIEKAGFRRIEKDGTILQPIVNPYSGFEISVLSMTKPTDWGLHCVNKFEELFSNSNIYMELKTDFKNNIEAA